jgi:hypothetical protein
MNGKVARTLRQIAQRLALAPQTEYAPGGVLRRRPGRVDDKGVLQPGPPIPRPIVMRECTRRAYKEAKKIFRGLPPTACVPQEEEKIKEKGFDVKIVDSMRKYIRDNQG